jgi:tRNA-uridine 2-sulfurtransferase
MPVRDEDAKSAVMRIVVAMSGGVDSSVAAALLVEQGHEVIGLSMQLYDVSERADGERSFGSCCTIDDLHDARRVAAAIGIPHYILNFERQFHEQVVSNFVDEYTAGRTPLPCAHCNSDLKFATLLDRARGLGADAVATGHYARAERTEAGRYHLRRGADGSKDQSYFLFALTQEQLARAVFPVGDRGKDAVREYAHQRGLPVAAKADSQEICFIPDHDYASFVTRRAPAAVSAGGWIRGESGQILGRHGGIHRFTVGQRKGLGLSSSAAGKPLYVLSLKAQSQEVIVGPKASLERTELTASGVNWIEGTPQGEGRRACVQIRHRHHPAPAIVRAIGLDRAEVVFDTPQIAVTPGQAAVFYDGDVVLGGGWIDNQDRKT